MLAGGDLAQFVRICTTISDDAADINGFVPLRSLLKRFEAKLVSRPLLVEGMIVSHNRAPAPGPGDYRWTVLLDSETHTIDTKMLDSETRGKALPSRLRNTVAHELVHTLAFSPTEFDIRLSKKYSAPNQIRELVKDIEQDTEKLSPLLLWAESSIEDVAVGKKEALSLRELNNLRRSLGISRFVLVNRLCLLKSSRDEKELLQKDALRNIAVGIGQWNNCKEPFFHSWPLFHNFDRSILPTFLHKLIVLKELAVSKLVHDESLVVFGGSNVSVNLSVRSGASNIVIRPNMSLEVSFEPRKPVAGSSFLYVFRTEPPTV